MLSNRSVVEAHRHAIGRRARADHADPVGIPHRSSSDAVPLSRSASPRRHPTRPWATRGRRKFAPPPAPASPAAAAARLLTTVVAPVRAPAHHQRVCPLAQQRLPPSSPAGTTPPLRSGAGAPPARWLPWALSASDRPPVGMFLITLAPARQVAALFTRWSTAHARTPSPASAPLHQIPAG
jgi:hypothetical protein